MTIDPWPMFEPILAPLLDPDDDDPGLWSAVVNTVYGDALALCRGVDSGDRVVTQIGRCSHWLRPHQSRWSADGGFAWPTGYDGAGFSRAGLPEFDWSGFLSWSPASQAWQPSTGEPKRGQLVFRVAVPSRSRRHRQAAIHSTWRPGAPPRPRTALTQFYGFRQRIGGWSCTAYSAFPGDRVYERAAADECDEFARTSFSA